MSMPPLFHAPHDCLSLSSGVQSSTRLIRVCLASPHLNSMALCLWNSVPLDYGYSSTPSHLAFFSPRATRYSACTRAIGLWIHSCFTPTLCCGQCSWAQLDERLAYSRQPWWLQRSRKVLIETSFSSSLYILFSYPWHSCVSFLYVQASVGASRTLNKSNLQASYSQQHMWSTAMI